MVRGERGICIKIPRSPLTIHILKLNLTPGKYPKENIPKWQSRVHAMKGYGEVVAQFHSLFTWTPVAGVPPLCTRRDTQ
jgi:hypothetical protein